MPPDVRAEAVRRALLTLEAYRAAYGWEPAALEVRVYPALRSGLPCGIGASGCAWAGGPILVGGDQGATFHEIHHFHRWSLGDPDWKNHVGDHWAPVWAWVPPW